MKQNKLYWIIGIVLLISITSVNASSYYDSFVGSTSNWTNISTSMIYNTTVYQDAIGSGMITASEFTTLGHYPKVFNFSNTLSGFGQIITIQVWWYATDAADANGPYMSWGISEANGTTRKSYEIVPAVNRTLIEKVNRTTGALSNIVIGQNLSCTNFVVGDNNKWFRQVGTFERTSYGTIITIKTYNATGTLLCTTVANDTSNMLSGAKLTPVLSNFNGGAVIDYFDNMYFLDGVDVIQFFTPTPDDGTYYNTTHNYIESNVSGIITNIINTTTRLYNSTGLYDSSYNTTGNVTYNFTSLPVGTYYLNATMYNSTTSISTDTRSIYIGLGVLNVYSVNTTSGVINNITLYATDINTGIIYNTSTTTGLNNISLYLGHNYSILLDATNYAYDTFSVNITNFSSTFNRTLYPSNALYFTIYNESNGGLITSSTSITLIANDGTSTYNTTTNASGRASILLVNANNYTATFTNALYRTRQLQIEVLDRTSQNISVYLNNGTAILFNYKDYASRPLSGVSLKIYGYVGGSIKLLGSYLSDPTGKVQWYASSDTYYAFNNTLSGYADYFFSLNPVLFSSYDIPMTASVSGAVVPSGYISFTPNSFYRNQSTNFSIQFISPYSSFTSYQYNFTYPGGSIANSGTSGSGQTFTNSFIVNGTSTTATLYYTFLLSNGASQTGNYTFTVVQPWQSKTFMNMGDNDYGMLIGDKVFWLTIILIVVMGAAYLAVGSAGAVIFGGIILLVMTFNGYIPVRSYPIYYVFGFAIAMILIFKGFTSGGGK